MTELRIHGVGGASPAEVLALPHARLVAGGRDAGFFRPESWLNTGLDWDLEAYSWGGITSRSRTRALWIFLLPFALLNVAGWMRDSAGSRPDDTTRSGRGWKTALVRTESLLTTAVFTVLIAILMIELIGYRCVALDGCVDNWFVAPYDWFADSVIEGVAVGTAVAAITMTAIAVIARRRRGETVDASERPSDPAGRVGIADPDLWARPDIANGLSLVHLSAALSLVSLAGLEAAHRLTSEPITTAASAAIGIVAICVFLAIRTGWMARLAQRATLAGAVALVAWTVVHIAGLGLATSPTPDGAIVVVTSYMVFALFLLVFFARWVIYLWQRLATGFTARPKPTADMGGDETSSDADPARAGSAADARPPLMPFSLGGRLGNAVGAVRRWAASTWRDDRAVLLSLRAGVPVLGAGIAVAVGSGILLRVDALLGTGYPTDTLDRVAVFGLGWIALVVITATWVWFSNPGRTPAQIIQEDLDGRPYDSESDRLWLQRISSAESVAKITDHVETVITVPAVIMFAAVGLTFFDPIERVIPALAGPASWVLSLIPLALIFAFNQLYRSRNFRRTLGIIWDVSTFWPKWFHPWAPPSYGERAVPHLVRRLRHLTSNGGSVVLSAHSQGTVVAAAALARLDESTRSRIAVVTVGSPLTRLYARYFGDVFTVDLYRRLAASLGDGETLAWSNLHRRTDYIGGPVFRTHPDEPETPAVSYVDQRLRDPASSEPAMEGDPRPPTSNHSNYYADPAYRETVAGFVRMFRSRA